MEKRKSALEIKAQIMLEELKLKYKTINDIGNDEKVIEKIIELNFDENKIKDYYYFDRLYQEIEGDFGTSGFTEEEVAKIKIKELNCDKGKIIDWIEGNLLGEN